MIRLRNLARRTVFGLLSAKRLASRYELARAPRPLRIILGAGWHHCPGWVSTDAEVRSPRTVYLDVRRRFPLPNASVNAYFAEHVLEHIPFGAALSMFAEIRRTLEPGGIFRCATPDLEQVCRVMHDDASDARRYVLKSNEFGNANYPLSGSPLVPDERLRDPTFAVNRCFYSWGHRFLWSEDLLVRALEAEGFACRRYPLGKSSSAHLRGIECRSGPMNEYETMVIEATLSPPSR